MCDMGMVLYWPSSRSVMGIVSRSLCSTSVRPAAPIVGVTGAPAGAPLMHCASTRMSPLDLPVDTTISSLNGRVVDVADRMVASASWIDIRGADESMC